MVSADTGALLVLALLVLALPLATVVLVVRDCCRRVAEAWRDR